MVIRRYRDAKVRQDRRGAQVSLEEILYMTGLVLWILQVYIGKTIFADFYGGKLLTAIRYFCMLIFAVKILLSEKSIRMRASFIVLLLTAVFLVVQRNINTGMPLIQLLLMILGAKDVSFKRICKVMFWTSLIAWFIPILVDRLGIYHLPQMYELHREREYLNYTYVSFAAIYFNNIVYCALYAYTDFDREGRGHHVGYRREVSWIAICIMAAVEVWLYAVTDTTLPFLVGMMCIALYVVTIKLRVPLFENRRGERILSLLLFPALAIGTYLIAKNYKSRVSRWARLDKMTHSRLSLANQGLKKYGVHAFGAQIVENTDMAKGSYFYIDSGYIKNLILYGLIVFVVVILMYSVMFYAAVVSRDKVLALMLFCIAVYSVNNNNLLSPVENGSILAFCYCIKLLSWQRDKRRAKRVRRKKGRREYIESKIRTAES